MFNPADLESFNGRRFCRQHDALNFARDLQVVIEPLLFVRLGVDDSVVERKGRLLCDRFENDKIALRKWRARRAVAEREHAHVLFPVEQRRHHDGSRPQRRAAQRRQLRRVGNIGEQECLAALPRASIDAFPNIDRVSAQIAIERDRGGTRLLQNMRRHFDERRAAFAR